MKKLVYLLLPIWILSCWSCSSGSDEPVVKPDPTPIPQNKVEVTTSEPVMEQQGGTASVSFTTNATWTANVSSSTSWCSVSPSSGAAGTHVLTVTSTANDTYDERNATVTINAGKASKSFTVKQKQKDALTVTSNKVEIGADGGDFTIEAKANVSVTYEIEESAKEWLSANESRGLTSTVLKFDAKANEKIERRQGNITLKGGDGLTEIVTVYQKGEDVSLVLTTEKDMTVGSEGGVLKIELESNVEVKMEALEAEWLRQSSSRSMSSQTFYIEVDANDTYDERNASITFTSGDKQQIVTVTQKQKDALTVTSKKVEIGADGGDFTIEAKANVSVTYEIEESAKEWLSANESRGLTSTVLIFNAKANEKIERRQGNITLKGGDGLTETVIIYQEGEKPSLVISSDDVIVNSDGSTIQVELKSNVEYTLVMPEVDWISEEKSRSISAYTHYLTIAPNDTYDQRTAMIYVQNEKEALKDSISITQMQLNAIVVAKNEYSVTSEGGLLEFNVNTNVDFDVSTNVDWIKQNVSSRGLVEKPLSFIIEGNAEYETREGVITISDGELKQEIIVKQMYKDIPFVIKQKYYNLSPNGGRFIVDIYYKKTYKILNWTGLGNAGTIIEEEGHDSYLFVAWEDNEKVRKEIIVSDENEQYTDTIYIEQTNDSEYLHGGDGNSVSGAIFYYSGGLASFDIHTNLDKFDILIFGNTEQHKLRHVNTEKTSFGYREFYEIPKNDTEKDLKFDIMYVGPNMIYVNTVTVKCQLFVHFDEPEEMYISEKGETFTTHAWTEDNNLNIRLEGSDTSWLTVKQTDDTYVDGVRRINTTFEAEQNTTGKTREISIVAFNGFDDKDVVRIIQPSGEGVLLSKEKMIVGAWENTQTIKLKDCEYTIEPDKTATWVSVGQATKENGAISQILKIEANKEEKELNAEVVIKSGSITHNLKIRQLPESGALVDDSSERWKSFQLPPVDVKQPYPNETGSMLYFAIVEKPEEFIHIQSRRVLDLLYYGPEDEFIPKLNYMEYVLDNYDGVSACYGGGGMKGIVLSNQYVESYYNANGARALVEENKGVLAHELTHAFQLEPKGCGDYGSSKVFHSCIEGMADAVRVLSGGFPHESDRPKGGHYLDSYRYTGFFIAWCVKNKDKDFLRKFNLSTQYVNPWSFDGAIKYVLGEEYNVEDLWKEYLKAMGDIK